MNAPRPPAGRWLQRELRLRLMLPILLIVTLTGVLAAYAAQHMIDRVFDRWLLDAARSLAAQVRFHEDGAHVDLPPQAEALLAYDFTDRVYYEVLQDGRHVLGQTGLPLKGKREHPYRNGARAFDASFMKNPIRVGAVPLEGPRGERVLVLVAETLNKRAQAGQDLLLVMAPLAVLVLAAAVAIVVAVRRTIVPLERIAARWKDRSHTSLDAIPADDVPRELLPFATALNDLLARVRGMLDRERRFAATAAHQLRTPLAGLQLGLARAAESPDLAATRTVLSELGQTTQRTARLVQQLLAISQLDPETRMGPGTTDTDLVALARAVGESYLDAAIARSIPLEFIATVPQLVRRVQPDLLSEALGNLIDNALRYTPAGGRVRITVRDAPAALQVCDTGPGVPPEEREAVFERFVRGQGAVGDGSGLGLAIVRDIAELHGASVSLEPGDGGRGSCVTLRFGP